MSYTEPGKTLALRENLGEDRVDYTEYVVAAPFATILPEHNPHTGTPVTHFWTADPLKRLFVSAMAVVSFSGPVPMQEVRHGYRESVTTSVVAMEWHRDDEEDWNPSPQLITNAQVESM